ncbi:MAG: carboxynorspermidine decarboxylase [Deltaproteobacteria bacterium]|nr:carboxynorspermidine decarboxylase [Deltaproteobacteria bacterium]
MVVKFNPADVPSPCFVIETEPLRHNLEILSDIKKTAGVKIVLAQKAFASFYLYPIISKYLDGVAASGLYEASLGFDEFKKEVHTYCPAFRDDEIESIISKSDHIIFNSLNQLNRFKQKVENNKNCSIGLRINPECSVASTPLYDPAAPGSRLGVLASELDSIDINIIDGLHFHALCEQSSYELEKILQAVEDKFSSHLHNLKWINMGGGHAFTRKDYDLKHFYKLIEEFKNRYKNLQIIFEPGSAVVWETGVLVSKILDITNNSGMNAVLDISCTCHTPDIIEMPYRAVVENEIPIDNAPYKYRLGGVSCLAGDQFGEYGFNKELNIGDKIVFKDMAHYTTVKTTMFNGVRHPSLALFNNNSGKMDIFKEFTYSDFKQRQG